MARILISYVIPLILPTLLYLGWASWARKKMEQAKAQGEDIEVPAIKTPWLRLIIAGVALTFFSLAITAVFSGSPAGSKYTPPHTVDGKTVPGSFSAPEN